MKASTHFKNTFSPSRLKQKFSHLFRYQPRTRIIWWICAIQFQMFTRILSSVLTTLCSNTDIFFTCMIWISTWKEGYKTYNSASTSRVSARPILLIRLLGLPIGPVCIFWRFRSRTRLHRAFGPYLQMDYTFFLRPGVYSRLSIFASADTLDDLCCHNTKWSWSRLHRDFRACRSSTVADDSYSEIAHHYGNTIVHDNAHVIQGNV